MRGILHSGYSGGESSGQQYDARGAQHCSFDHRGHEIVPIRFSFADGNGYWKNSFQLSGRLLRRSPISAQHEIFPRNIAKAMSASSTS
jgi:hypothetical protein